MTYPESTLPETESIGSSCRPYPAPVDRSNDIFSPRLTLMATKCQLLKLTSIADDASARTLPSERLMLRSSPLYPLPWFPNNQPGLSPEFQSLLVMIAGVPL